MEELSRTEITEQKETNKKKSLLEMSLTEELGYLRPTYNLMQRRNQNMIRRNLQPGLF